MIGINNLTTIQIKEEFLRKVAKKVLEEENKEEADLSIALVGPGRIRALNKKYRKKNRVTDVLAFLGNGLGEIVICLRQIKKNAKRFSSTFEKELARVLIHGILHLLGYNHEKTEKEAQKMREKEDYYLRLFF
jgi:probable rRNA maturation factor